MIPDFLNKSLIPQRSGVYIFKNNDGKVLYVGKAIDLYHRVASYFSNFPASWRENVKLKSLVGQIAKVETIIVESELEALILEANLIKKYLPSFNVRLTDDKDYLYIGVTREDAPRSRLAAKRAAGGAGFPKIKTLRKMDLPKVKKYWGPFPSARTVRDTLKSLRKVFPWCSGVGYRVQGTGYSRPCFYYHLGLCAGPCAGMINKEDYRKIINGFSKFMDGKKGELVEELSKEMMKLSDGAKFEEAGKIKKIINGILYMTQSNRTKLYLENPNFLEEETTLALSQLQKDLNLTKLPDRIEGYDISNIQGKEAVGSMVVLTNGDIDKSQYRKFKIRISGRPNDVGMHKEMIRRRLKHPQWPIPDLIIVDGGRGQAKGVKFEIRNVFQTASGRTKFEIPVFGLAKRMEWLYPPEGEIIKLPRKSLSLKLLQKLRDESHRFAIAFYRKLHQKSVII